MRLGGCDTGLSGTSLANGYQGTVFNSRGYITMRVLLINPEFPESFWTFKESCKMSGRKTFSTPLGLITAAALLPPEWEMRLVDLNARRLTEEDWNHAEMVMVTGMIVQRDNMVRIIREAKERGKTVAAGGPYVTSVPDDVLDAGCDFLVKGEGEITILPFVDAIKEGKTHGIFEAESRPVMSISPIPRFDLLHLEDYAMIGVQTSRGCPFDCEFCDIVNLYGRLPRYKTPPQVIAELDALFNLGWRGPVMIVDDNFIGGKKHARAILRELIPWSKQRGGPFAFSTQTSVNLGQDLETIDLMTEANFGNVLIGIESPDHNVLALSRKFQNIRNPMVESLDNINRNGLTVTASFIVGFDEEKKGAGERICGLVESTSIPMAYINPLRPLPNTSLWDRLKREGRLLEVPTQTQPDIIEDCLGRLNYIPTRPEFEIMEEYVEALERLYKPEKYLARAYRYMLAMRPTRRALGTENPENWGAPHKVAKVPLSVQFHELTAFFRLIWRQGIVAPYRLQFWKQLIGILRHNPSRARKYLLMCALGENIFGLAEIERSRVEAVRKNGSQWATVEQDAAPSRSNPERAPTVS